MSLLLLFPRSTNINYDCPTPVAATTTKPSPTLAVVLAAALATMSLTAYAPTLVQNIVLPCPAPVALTTAEPIPTLVQDIVLNCPDPTRTNISLYANDFSNVAWPKGAVTVSTGELDPDGGTTAWKMLDNTTTAEHFIRQVYTGAAAGLYTTRVRVKQGTYTVAGIQINCNGTWTRTTFNLATGVISSNGATFASIEAIGNGYYLCSSTRYYTSGTFQAILNMGPGTYLGTGQYIYATNIETGMYRSGSFIPTTASTATAASIGTVEPSPTLGISLDGVTPSALTFTADAPTLSITGGGTTLNCPTPVAVSTATPSPSLAITLQAPTPTAITTVEPTPSLAFGLAAPNPTAVSTATFAPTLTQGTVLSCPTPTAITTTEPTPSLVVILAAPAPTAACFSVHRMSTFSVTVWVPSL